MKCSSIICSFLSLLFKVEKFLLAGGFFVLASLSFSVKSQGRKIVFQIDTLEIAENKEEFKFQVRGKKEFEFQISGKKYLKDFCFWPPENDVLHFDSYPNYSAKINLESDSTEIIIPIDYSFGYVRILSAYNEVIDTLRIQRLTLYDCPFSDTVYKRITYWKVLNGSIEEVPYKEKFKKKVMKKKCPCPFPKEITLRINKKQYSVSFVQSKANETVTSGHRKRPVPYRKNGNERSRYTYIHFYSRVIEFQREGVISLHKNTN